LTVVWRCGWGSGWTFGGHGIRILPYARAVNPKKPDLCRLTLVEPLRRLPGRNATKATVLFYRVDGIGVAVKSYAERPWMIRHALGRWLISREAAAYRAAAGVAGLPAFYGRLGPFALATEWIAARPLAHCAGQEFDQGFFDRIATILDTLHARGIALADLHHRDVLVAEDGSPYLIDLAMAWRLGERPGRWRKMLFARFRDADRVALARMSARFTGGDMEAAVAAVGPTAAAWHRRGRRVKALFDRLRGKRRS